MKNLTLAEILELQKRMIDKSGGSHGVRDIQLVESAIAQPEMAFGGCEIYPTLEEKAAALGFSLIKNHAFIDGNKRIGEMAMEFFLLRNGLEIQATVDEQEAIILHLAASEIDRDAFTEWVKAHTIPRA